MTSITSSHTSLWEVEKKRSEVLFKNSAKLPTCFGPACTCKIKSFYLRSFGKWISQQFCDERDSHKAATNKRGLRDDGMIEHSYFRRTSPTAHVEFTKLFKCHLCFQLPTITRRKKSFNRDTSAAVSKVSELKFHPIICLEEFSKEKLKMIIHGVTNRKELISEFQQKEQKKKSTWSVFRKRRAHEHNQV